MKTQAPSPRASFILSPRRQGAGWGTASRHLALPPPSKSPVPWGRGGLPSAWQAEEGGKSCHPPPPPTSLRPERGVRTGDVSRAAGRTPAFAVAFPSVPG